MADSRTSRSASRLPGRAIAVMRLARLTGRPNQSPARGEGDPDGRAGAQLREVLALGVGGVDQAERRVQQRLGLGEASIAASPIVLTSRTGGSATSDASASSRTAR